MCTEKRFSFTLYSTFQSEVKITTVKGWSVLFYMSGVHVMSDSEGRLRGSSRKLV